MVIGTIGAAVLALFAISSSPGGQEEAVSLIGTTFGSAAADPRALNDRFVRESRDERWASVTEVALDTRIAPIPHIGPIKVRCATTLCQVAGWIGPGDSNQINVAMRELQGEEFRDGAARLGLETGAMWFSDDKADRGRTTFVIFLERKTTNS